MKQSRREFFKVIAVTAGALTVLPTVRAFAEERKRGGSAAGGELPLVEPGKGMAAGVNYHNKNSDVKDAKLKTDRQGVPFAKQSCSNCQLYAKNGTRKGEEVGTCTIFQGQVVKGSGWCGTWQKKA